MRPSLVLRAPGTKLVSGKETGARFGQGGVGHIRARDVGNTPQSPQLEARDCARVPGQPLPLQKEGQGLVRSSFGGSDYK